MPRFTELSITSYDDAGIPDLGSAEGQWVNIDLVESVQERVSDTFFHSVRYAPGFYPHLLLTLASGRELVVPLGEYNNEADARTALRAVADGLMSGAELQAFDGDENG